MTDREKMIDLIINAKKSDPKTGSFTEYLADFLLGYGIKLPDPTPQPGKPLTLEQLREMDGQPVWIVEFPDWGHWELSEDAGKWKDIPFALFEKNSTRFEWNIEGRELSLYSYPPAHIDRSKWTAEWVPMTDDDGCVWLECSACEYDLDSLEEPHPFCPSCGRAMTPEAWAELERRLRG